MIVISSMINLTEVITGKWFLEEQNGVYQIGESGSKFAHP